MDKMDKFIMVVPREKVFPEQTFQGFLHHQQEDLIGRIMQHHEYRRRGDMEQDPSFKQPIPYCLIVDADTGKIFAYQRGTKVETTTESRLHGKWSLGLGGHIDDDHKGDIEPLKISLMRELEEEIGLTNPHQVDVLGYINDDSNDVGQVHLGVVYRVVVKDPQITLSDEIATGQFYTVEELREEFANADVETWSRILFDGLLHQH